MKNIEFVLDSQTPFRFIHKEEIETADWENIHAHQGIELLYIHRGFGHIVINKRLFPIRDHSFVIIQPFEMHKLNMTIDTNQPYVRTIFIFDPLAMESFVHPFPQLAMLLNHIWKQQLTNQVLYDTEDSSVIRTLYTTLSMCSNLCTEDMGLFLLNILSEMKRNFVGLLHEGGSEFNRIPHHTELIMEWIDEHMNEDFKIMDIADALHLSEHYIPRLFHKYTGLTIIQYTNIIRMRKACSFLALTSLSLKEICSQIGVSSSSYLCQIFRKHYGITPQNYRLENNDS